MVSSGIEASPLAALADWPCHSHLELGALPTAVPCARLHTRQVLWEWGLQPLADPAELIVSELVTNGLHASEGLTGSRHEGRWAPGVPPLRLWLHGDEKRVLIQVWDGSDKLPTRQEMNIGAESGRGLFLVEAMSKTWGSYEVEGSSGKIVWVLVG